MARKKNTSDCRNSDDEVAHITSERLELLEVIQDLVRLEVKKQLTDNLMNVKPPSNTQGGDSGPPKLHKKGE